jgi:tetratricopeptide (TPR) repeat protein
MDRDFINSIQKMVKGYGKDILLDARKAKSMLADFTQNQFPKETNVLKQLLDAQCANIINEADNVAEVKAGLVKRLEDEQGLSPKVTADLLDLLGLVLRGDTTVTASTSPANTTVTEFPQPLKPDAKKPAAKKDTSKQSAADFYAQGRAAYNAKDYVKAVKLFSKAAEQGHADAQTNLGTCFNNGFGVPKDVAKAAEWFRKAAEQGKAQAKGALKDLKEQGLI